MTIFEYIAHSNPEGAKRVINSYGQKAIRRPDMLSRQLADTVNQNGKEALYRIASVHPDLELLAHFNDHNTSEEKGKEEKSCSCKDKESNFSSAEGQAIKQAVEDLSRKQSEANKPAENKTEKSELMIIGAVALIGLALVMKK